MFCFLALRTLETTDLGCVPGKVRCASMGLTSSESFPYSFVVSKSQVKWFQGVEAKLYYFSFDFLSHAISIPNMELLTCSKFFSRQ